MGKRKYQSKPISASLPKGLPNPKKRRVLPHSRTNITTANNPFENARPSSSKAPKFHVNNRSHSGRINSTKGPQSALQRSIEARRTALKTSLQESKKAGSFIDRRIGEAKNGRMGGNSLMSEDERMLARLVRERARRSKKVTKYSLDGDDDGNPQSSGVGGDILTHRGQLIDETYTGEFNAEDVILSDDDEGTKYDKQAGQLERADTELHFGGGGFDKSRQHNPYGPSGGSGVETLQDRYVSRKEEVDDFILRKKIEKAEKKKKNMEQVEKFDELDENFSEFASLLQFRDKEKDREDQAKSRKEGTLSKEDKEMDEWDKEMKKYMFERRVKATDRTKTPEELAKEEHERLKELEMRRLARMDGDFKEDDLSDISDVEGENSKRNRRKKNKDETEKRNPDEIDSEEEDDDDELRPKFTADGLVYLDKDGNVVKKVGADDGNTSVSEEISSDDDGSNDSEEDDESEDGNKTKGDDVTTLQKKRQKAKEKARTEMPYVFEVPTTLEALHDVIGSYAETGTDACTIIQRIHASNSVRLDKNNKDKMQNFYDVVLRRFIGVGDALYRSGNGGKELVRYEQLDTLTKVLYNMAQDFPSTASAVWGRRIGFFQNKLGKLLRDSEIIGMDDDDDFTTWPSTGTLLLLRAMGHIFPPTDLRHVVVTPILIFLGQCLTQCHVTSVEDIVRGIFCSGLMIEYTKDAKRYPPEAIAFLSSVIRLYSLNSEESCRQCSLPSFMKLAKHDVLGNLRENVITNASTSSDKLWSSLSLERKKIQSPMTPTCILLSTLSLIQKVSNMYCSSMNGSEPEIFDMISHSILELDPRNRKSMLPSNIATAIGITAEAVSKSSLISKSRLPLQRRVRAKASDLAIETYAPRMEDHNTYAMSKDKGKSRTQAEKDRMRREYKREYKAVTRELRLDAAFIENERRKEQNLKDTKARERRQKNYSWLEQEQATLNQQVAQGGGLLKGGGIGAARLKAKSGKMGIKRGGKF